MREGGSGGEERGEVGGFNAYLSESLKQLDSNNLGSEWLTRCLIRFPRMFNFQICFEWTSGFVRVLGI